MERQRFLVATLVALGCPALLSQTAAPLVSSASSVTSFDVATIKPHASGANSSWLGIMASPDGVNANAATLQGFVRFAYGLRVSDQVTGGPDWVNSFQFDMQAKMSEADVAHLRTLSTEDATAFRRQMMQSLLAERFKLKVHSETKQVPVFELVVAKGGPKMQDAATDTSDKLRRDKDGKVVSGMFFQQDKGEAQNETMRTLANFLSSPMAGLGRPVVDKTGLTGTYDFTLNWSAQGARMLNGVATYSTPSDDAPSIFTALGEIGLKLRPGTGPTNVIVIDHAERPSDN